MTLRPFIVAEPLLSQTDVFRFDSDNKGYARLSSYPSRQ